MSKKELNIDVEVLLNELGGPEALQNKLAAAVGDRGNRFSGDEHNIAMYIQRSKNQNVVCYRGTYADAAANVLDPKAPIDAYWLDIDPEYVKDNRAKGKMDDRCELNLIDRTMAYGHSVENPVEVKGMAFYGVSFVSLSCRKMVLTTTLKNGVATPVLLCKISNVVSVATRIWVQATEPKHFWNLPSVEYVEVFGFSVATGEPTYEKITTA